MSELLLATKFQVPRCAPGTVRRPRLVNRLRECLAWTPTGQGDQGQGGAFARKLTLISAPAGFGKTTLLGEWIDGLANIRLPPQLAWVSLDPSDDDAVRFLMYLIAALQGLEPTLGVGLLGALGSPQPPPIRAVLTTLLNALAQVPYPIALALDDYHSIEQPEIHDAVAFLIEYLPRHVHVILVTRADPPLPLARLRGRGQMAEIRAVDLRFTSDEAIRFLNEATGLDLPSGAIVALTSRTEGWIAGLQLAALSLGQRLQTYGPAEIERFVESFAGDDRFVVDYLVEEVLAGQPEAVQSFLLQTSILNQFCAPLCDAVTERSNSWATLQELERRNLFLVPLDQKRVWYCYHQLFADLLRQRLEQSQPEWLPGLHRRASFWCEQNGYPEEAIRHAMAAEDLEAAARLIVETSWAMSARGDMSARLAWLEALPADLVRSQPQLSLVYAWSLFYVMELDKIEPWLQNAERILQGWLGTGEAAAPGIVRGQARTVAGEPLTRQDVESMLGEVATLRSTVASIVGDVELSLEQADKAVGWLPEGQRFLRGIVADVLGTAYEARGNVKAASDAFADSILLCQQGGNPVVALIAMGNLGRLQEVQGQLRQAAGTYREALDYAATLGEQPVPVAGMAHVGLGGLFYEWNELEQSREHLHKGIHLGEQMANVEIQANGCSLLARVCQAGGDPRGAREALGQALDLVGSYEVSTGSASLVQASRAWLWLADGRWEAIAEWLQGAGFQSSSPVSRQAEFGHLMQARLQMTQGEYPTAIDLLVRLSQLAEDEGRYGSRVRILAVLAMAWQGRGEARQALEVLSEALSLAEPEGYIRVFVDEGDPMSNLLRLAMDSHALGGYVARLRAACLRRGTPISEGSGPHTGGVELLERLSERELEILQRIAAGLTNREIAAELFITVGTVKWHTNNLYGKLQVRRRTEAVARARELGIL